MIDLHCHTKHSDGTWKVVELLSIAEKKGIEILSITDHDTVAAHFEAETMNIKDIYKGKLITGVEINCVFDNTKIELLGYNFEKEKVQEWLEELYGKDRYRTSMLNEFADMCNICKKNGVVISEKIKYNPDKEYPIDVIYYDVIKYPENKNKIDDDAWENRSIFFRKCTTDKNFILYRDFTKSLPSAKVVSKIIKENGGKVFLAHLFIYKMENHMEFLKNICDAGIIDGVECYYSKFNLEQTKLIEKFCKDNNLYMSGGSDCHGERKKDIDLGIGCGDLNVNKVEIEKWI